MNIQEIYELAIKKGINADVRGKKGVDKFLKKLQAKFKKLSKTEKANFDQDSLKNPYADSRLLYGNPKKSIKSIMVGIDISSAEIMLADYLNQKGKEKIDLVISHHPHGIGLAGLYEVMSIQEDLMSELGIPVNIMEKIMSPRIHEIKRAVHPSNINQVVDAARILDIPFGCMHTSADNLAYKFMTDLVKKKGSKMETLGEIVDILNDIPEYVEANKFRIGPQIVIGNKESKAGKVVATEMTGGTNGAKEMYAELNKAGVGTILSMHMSEVHKKEAEKQHINVIVCGHIASDSLGINLYLDELEKKGIKIVPVGGFIRISRVKKSK